MKVISPTKIVVTPIGEALGEPATPLSERISARETLKGVWLGQPGPLPLEVFEIVSTNEPSVQTIRSVWHKRRRKHAAPLIVFWQGPEHVLLTEPVGEPASIAIVQVVPSAALTIIERALATPQRDAVQTALALIERSQGSGGVAGFRNRNLLSTHYLTQGFRRDRKDEWIDLDNRGASMRTEKGARLLRALGYVPSNQASTFEVKFDGRCRVHAIVLAEDTSFDRSQSGPGDAPSTRVLVESREKGAERAVLVSGSVLRLYLTNSTQGLNDLATAGTYIELDLDILGKQWSALLPLIFAADSHAPSGLFDQIISESARYAIGLRERFRERVYEDVVAGLLTALFDARGRKHADAELLFNATLRLLYRLLFVLYAEDRNLLPLRNPEYRRVSLTEMLFRIEEMRRTGKPFEPKQTTLWDDLFRIFDAIRIGNLEWNIPAYNGGLFEPRLPDYAEAAFLTDVRIPNATLAPLLLALAFDGEGDGRGKVDFGDLGVRHLGTLYEGLLSYTVHIAEQDLVVDTGGMYVPAKKSDKPVVLSGEPYLASPKGGRKTSGSYYTPSFVVRRLIDNALRPTLESHLSQVVQLPPEQQWEAMLDFRVVDPAMGSGHFLVDALDAIADRLASFLRDNPRISSKPVDEARSQITAIGKEYGVEDLGKGVGDFELLRRNVMRNCIYGVDLNPMAVELAKLSLWLHAFVPGLPLSYLGHNLRRGNALVGVVGHEIEAQLGDQLFGNAVKESLNTALEYSRRLAASNDLSVPEVKRSEETQDQMEGATKGLRDAFNAYACRVFAVDVVVESKKERERGRALLEQADGLQQVLLGKVTGPDKKQISNAQKVAVTLCAFHWQLAFPEVFLRERPGFDVVLGNPPWEEVTVERLSFFGRYIPGLKSFTSQLEQERIIGKFGRAHPDVANAYLVEVDEKERFRHIIRANYLLARSGDPDLYRAFAELALNIARKGGGLGMVYPRTLLAADGTAPYRERLFAESTVTADFGLNTGGWIFEGAEQRYTIVALSARFDNGGVINIAGPAVNEKEWSALPDIRTRWSFSELKMVSPGLEVPLMPNIKSAQLFRMMIANGQPFSAPLSGVQFRPWRAFDATNDRKNGLLKDRSKGAKGWPVIGGRNFYLWQPDIGETEFVLDEKAGIAALQRKRQRSEVWAEIDPSIIADPRTLPPFRAHILFRAIGRSTDSRTVIAVLVPPKRFARNQAPILIQNMGSAMDAALRLGTMCSLPFDWAARRRVEIALNFFILNSLPVPTVTLDDPRARRVASLSARLACIDQRFAVFAKDCNVPVGSLVGIECDNAIAEIDALVASMYGLGAADLETLFTDFSLDAVPESRREATRNHFTTLTQRLTTIT